MWGGYDDVDADAANLAAIILQQLAGFAARKVDSVEL